MAAQSETSSAASASPSSSKPRRKRRWLRWLGGVVIVLLALIVLLPTLISLGIANGYIRSTINKSINGTADLNRIKLSWFGGQSIDDLSITDARGNKAADLDVRVDSSLFKLLVKRNAPVHIDLSGTVNGTLRKDGSLSFEELIARDQTKAGPPKPKPQPKPGGEPVKLPDLPPLTLNLSGLTLNLAAEDSAQTLVLQDLTGKVALNAPSQPITIDLHGKTVTNGVPGSVEISGQADGLFDQRRTMTISGASAKLDVAAKSIPLPLPGIRQSAQVQSLALNVRSDDLTSNIVITMQSDAQVQGYEPSHLKADVALGRMLTSTGGLNFNGASAHIKVEGQSLPLLGLRDERDQEIRGQVKSINATVVSENLTDSLELSLDGDAQIEGHDPSKLKALLTIEQPFTSDGKPNIGDPALLTGTISGQVIPTALAQRFLNDTPIVATRDIGPTVDLNAAFSSGTQHDVTIMAAGPKARLEVRANVNQVDQSLTGTHLLLTTPAADPALIKGLTNLTVDRPTDVEIVLNSFALPPVDATINARPKTKYAATGSLRVKGPTIVELPGEKPQRFNVEGAVISIESPALEQYLNVEGSAIVEGAGVTINERITKLFNLSGELAAMNALPVGVIEVKKLPGSVVNRFAPPEQAEMVSTIVGEALNATITTDVTDTDNLRAVITGTAALLNANITAIRRPEALHLAAGDAALTITPQLASMLQKTSAKPIELAQPTAATISLKPFDLPTKTPNSLEYDLPSEPIRATIAVEDIIADKVPNLAEAVGLSKINAEVEAKVVEPKSYAIAGEAQVRRTKVDRAVTSLKYDLKAIQSGDDFSPSGTLNLRNVSMRHLEALLGQERGGISRWAGDKGNLAVEFSSPAQNSYQATINSQLPNLAGEFIASMQNEMVSLTAKTSTLTLTKAALESRLNPAPPKDATAKERKAAVASRLTVDADVPLTLTISQLSFPMAMVREQPFDPKAVDLALALGGGPVTITTRDGVKTSLADLDLKLNTKNIKQGIAFTLNTKARAAVEEGEKLRKAGSIDVQGKIIDLINADNTLHTEAAKLQMTANVNGVPTMLADAFTNMDGLLVAALGPKMNAKFEADDFSGSTGTLDTRIDTTNGFLEAAVRGKEEALRSNKNKPINAELKFTEPLRQRLLEKLHPVLADVRTTKQPLRANITKAVIPTDGDVSRLNADIEITIGEVEFDSGSTTLKIMSLFSESTRETIPGRIDPIHAKIRNGVLKYDTFLMQIDKYEMPFTGEIDLVKRKVDLHTKLPLAALAVAIPQLEGRADKIMVPLVTRGEFGKVKTSIDPDFDVAKAALEAGLKDPLEDLLKGGKNPLEDLLNKPKKP